jgi:hypothetical protein
MKNLSFKKVRVFGLILMFSVICSLGYTQKGSDDSSLKGGIKLEYKYPSGSTFRYFSDTKIVQEMDVNGQSMLVNISMYMGCEVKSAGKQGENLQLEITIDSMAQNIESPQGVTGGPIKEINGKVFNIVISASGKTTDISEAANITYTIEGSGEGNVAESFRNFFPVLPSETVKPGDTWSLNDTVNTKSKTNKLWMPLQSNYKFEGIEKVDGIDCAKISATLSGERKMTTQSQGMGDINTSGPFIGNQVLFFAVKEGYLLKESVTTKMTGIIELPDQGMSFPVVMNITSTNQLRK